MGRSNNAIPYPNGLTDNCARETDPIKKKSKKHASPKCPHPATRFRSKKRAVYRGPPQSAPFEPLAGGVDQPHAPYYWESLPRNGRWDDALGLRGHHRAHLAWSVSQSGRLGETARSSRTVQGRLRSRGFWGEVVCEGRERERRERSCLVLLSCVRKISLLVAMRSVDVVSGGGGPGPGRPPREPCPGVSAPCFFAWQADRQVVLLETLCDTWMFWFLRVKKVGFDAASG